MKDDLFKVAKIEELVKQGVTHNEKFNSSCSQCCGEISLHCKLIPTT